LAEPRAEGRGEVSNAAGLTGALHSSLTSHTQNISCPKQLGQQ
jgi:hypothetical protein